MISTTKNSNDEQRKLKKAVLNMQSFHLKRSLYFEEKIAENKNKSLCVCLLQGEGNLKHH